MSVQLPKDFSSRFDYYIKRAAYNAKQSHLKGLSDQHRDKLARIVTKEPTESSISKEDLEGIYQTLSTLPSVRPSSNIFERILKGIRNILGQISGHRFGRYSSEELYTKIQDARPTPSSQSVANWINETLNEAVGYKEYDIRNSNITFLAKHIKVSGSLSFHKDPQDRQNELNWIIQTLKNNRLESAKIEDKDSIGFDQKDLPHFD